jgi:hypothetical protein
MKKWILGFVAALTVVALTPSAAVAADGTWDLSANNPGAGGSTLGAIDYAGPSQFAVSYRLTDNACGDGAQYFIRLRIQMMTGTPGTRYLDLPGVQCGNTRTTTVGSPFYAKEIKYVVAQLMVNDGSSGPVASSTYKYNPYTVTTPV